MLPEQSRLDDTERPRGRHWRRRPDKRGVLLCEERRVPVVEERMKTHPREHVRDATQILLRWARECWPVHDGSTAR